MNMHTIREHDMFNHAILLVNSINKIERTGATTFKYIGKYVTDIETAIKTKLKQHELTIDRDNDTGDYVSYDSQKEEYSILMRDFNNIISIEIISNTKETLC